MDVSTFAFEFVRVFLALFFTGVAGFYTFRIILKKNQSHQEVIFPGKRFCKTWWNHLAFRFFRAAIWMVCVCRLFFPEMDYYLGMIDLLTTWPVILFGSVLLIAGFGIAIAVHMYHGDEWRSGIDPGGPRQLKTQGLYHFSRNPMFAGVAVAQFGFFLALPSCFTLTCLVVGWYTLYSQILAEEKHLSQVFPDVYPDYKDLVRRWL